jgi:membrane protein
VGVAARIDGFQQRHRWLGFPIAVVYKFVDDQGGYLAALITYYGFLSLFPLLLLLVTVLGFVLAGNTGLQQEVLGSALRQFPIIGTQLRENVHSLRGSGLGLAVGIVVTLYGAIGVAQAAQTALNRVWAVPRNERPDPFTSRLRSLAILLLPGAGILVTTVLTGLGAAAGEYGAELGTGVRVLATLLSVATNIVLSVVAFRVLTAHEVGTRDVLVGAVTAAVGWQLVQVAGTVAVANQLKGATEVYGFFGVVLGLILFIYCEAVIIVLSAEINVVKARRLWPRALLTPFTDQVELTGADERAYTSYATSERHKGFEEVEVSFGDDQRKVGGDPDRR